MRMDRRDEGNSPRLISGFRSEVAGNCALVSYYAESGGNFLQAFRDKMWAPSSGLKILEITTTRCVTTQNSAVLK